jgi:predicted DNA-binding protein
MTRDKYQGKRNNVTFPPEMYDKIKELADSEGRTYSQMVVRLCAEALQAREEQSK